MNLDSTHSTQVTLTETSLTESTSPQTKANKVMRYLRPAAWVAFTLFCLIIFTFWKLPQDRTRNLIQGHIASQLAQKGVAFTAGESWISLGLGVTYTMKDVRLTPPSSDEPILIDRIEISPKLTALLFKKIAGSIYIKAQDGTLSGDFSSKGEHLEARLKLKHIDFGKTGAFLLLAGIKGGLNVSGTLSFAGNPENPFTFVSEADLDLSKFELSAQSIAGFNVPKVSASEGRIQLSSTFGKGAIKSLRLGNASKKDPADDLILSIEGDLTLGQRWDASQINARTKLQLSAALLKSFVLIDAFLGPGKQADGSYLFDLQGPLTAPNPVPVTAGAAK
ncbi:type II secretion system protein GspN [Bdellovibrionota bacterium FG-2]